MVHRQGAPRARPDSNATSYWPAVACALACAAVALASSRFDWKLDDSYITFSYAQNWVQGHGIVFNRGEYVEGYTCFLWVALSALGLRLGADIAPWSTVLGILGAIGTVVVTWRFAASWRPSTLPTARLSPHWSSPAIPASGGGRPPAWKRRSLRS